ADRAAAGREAVRVGAVEGDTGDGAARVAEHDVRVGVVGGEGVERGVAAAGVVVGRAVVDLPAGQIQTGARVVDLDELVGAGGAPGLQVVDHRMAAAGEVGRGEVVGLRQIHVRREIDVGRQVDVHRQIDAHRQIGRVRGQVDVHGQVAARRHRHVVRHG